MGGLIAVVVPLCCAVVHGTVTTGTEDVPGAVVGSTSDEEVAWPSDEVVGSALEEVDSALEEVVGSTGVEVGGAGLDDVLVLGGGITLRLTVAPHSSREVPSGQQPALVQ
jgi:hypothetical protein